MLQFLFTPKVRWFQLRPVSQRFIRRFKAIAAFYEAAQLPNDDEASKRKGEWEIMRSVPFVFGVHTLVDALEPLADLNVRFQAQRSMICEIKDSWRLGLRELNSLWVRCIACHFLLGLKKEPGRL